MQTKRLPMSPAYAAATAQFTETFHPKSLNHPDWEDQERLSRGNVWVALLRAHYARVMAKEVTTL